MLDGGPACCATVSWLELAWTLASGLVLASSLHFMALRAADLWLGWRVRRISRPEWIVAQAQFRHMFLRSLKAILAGGVGLMAMTTPPGRPVAGSLGALALLGIVMLLALDQALDEWDGVRLSVAVRREREASGSLDAWDGTERRRMADPGR